MIQTILPIILNHNYSLSTLLQHHGIKEAIETLIRIFVGEGNLPNLYLHGPSGTGKTHILKSLISNCNGKNSKQQALYFSAKHDSDKKRIHSLSEQQQQTEFAAIAIDDIHLLESRFSNIIWNLENILVRTRTPLLLASLVSPDMVFLNNSHLQSRFKSGLIFQLEPPDDATKLIIMDNIAAQKQIRISREVYNYLLTRKTRNIKELIVLLNRLDSLSLEYKRPITIQFIKSMEMTGNI